MFTLKCKGEKPTFGFPQEDIELKNVSPIFYMLQT